MSDRDPLADPLVIALYPLIFKAAESGATKDYYIEAARVAREHIAKEIEAARFFGWQYAASLIRREND